jgi:hypothetical protein
VAPLYGGAEHLARGGCPKPVGIHEEAPPMHSLLFVVSSPWDCRWE